MKGFRYLLPDLQLGHGPGFGCSSKNIQTFWMIICAEFDAVSRD